MGLKYYQQSIVLTCNPSFLIDGIVTGITAGATGASEEKSLNNFYHYSYSYSAPIGSEWRKIGSYNNVWEKPGITLQYGETRKIITTCSTILSVDIKTNLGEWSYSFDADRR